MTAASSPSVSWCCSQLTPVMHGCSTARISWPHGSPETASSKRRARNSPYRGDRYRVFDRLEGQLSPRRAGVRLLGSGNRSGRHHPWVSDRQNRCYCLVANFKYVWLACSPQTVGVERTRARNVSASSTQDVKVGTVVIPAGAPGSPVSGTPAVVPPEEPPPNPAPHTPPGVVTPMFGRGSGALSGRATLAVTPSNLVAVMDAVSSALAPVSQTDARCLRLNARSLRPTQDRAGRRTLAETGSQSPRACKGRQDQRR